jgi:hypothetical protein
MKSRRIVTIIFVSIMLMLVACQGSGGAVPVAPTEDVQKSVDATLTAIAAAVPTSSPTPQVDTQATANAQASATAIAQASATAEAQLSATVAAVTAKAENAAATVTQAAGKKLTATAEVAQKATVQAQGMLTVIDKLFADGIISTKEGEYIRLQDFDESWAQINWYQWWETGYSANNFVLVSDMEWSSASKNANWPTSGCGFVYGEVGNPNHNISWAALDGYLYTQNVTNDNRKWLAYKKWGTPAIPEGQLHFMMVMFDKRLTFYVNDAEVVSTYDSLYVPGNINYTLMSGTNAGYGTRCKIFNVDLFIFK